MPLVILDQKNNYYSYKCKKILIYYKCIIMLKSTIQNWWYHSTLSLSKESYFKVNMQGWLFSEPPSSRKRLWKLILFSFSGDLYFFPDFCIWEQYVGHEWKFLGLSKIWKILTHGQVIDASWEVKVLLDIKRCYFPF